MKGFLILWVVSANCFIDEIQQIIDSWNLLQEWLRGGCVRSIVLAIQVPTQWQICAHDASEYE